MVRGEARGRTIGFPTANIASNVLLPPHGVYAVLVDRVLGAGSIEALAAGVMNIGVRPTVSAAGKASVEVNLLDFARDLYGETLRVHVVAKIREERRFASLDALKAQIAVDADEARAATKGMAATSG